MCVQSKSARLKKESLHKLFQIVVPEIKSCFQPDSKSVVCRQYDQSAVLKENQKTMSKTKQSYSHFVKNAPSRNKDREIRKVSLKKPPKTNRNYKKTYKKLERRKIEANVIVVERQLQNLLCQSAEQCTKYGEHKLSTVQYLTGENLRSKHLFSCLCKCFLWEECCQFVFFTFIQKIELNCKFFCVYHYDLFRFALAPFNLSVAFFTIAILQRKQLRMQIKKSQGLRGCIL